MKTNSTRKVKMKNLENGKMMTTQKSFETTTDANDWVEQFELAEHLEVLNVKIEDNLLLKQELLLARKEAQKKWNF